jgi:hypothetical protein
MKSEVGKTLPLPRLTVAAESRRGDQRLRFRLRLATRAFLFSAAAVTIAGALGQQILDSFAFPGLVLQIAAGLILFLVALQAVMQQYDVARPPDRTEPPTLALSPHSHFQPSLPPTGSRRLSFSLPKPKSNS